MTRDPHNQNDLDQNLEDTFPASDPLPPANLKKGPSKADEEALDEALEETFPASDPIPANPGVA
jgi:hypothetical protein